MIIQKIFHTFRDDFPLLSNGRLPPSFDLNTYDNLITSLILDLSDLTSFSRFTYITRHTNDNIPKDHLEPFLINFGEFVQRLGSAEPYNIPTVWFVEHFVDYDMVSKIRSSIDAKNIKYFESGGEYGSFEEINDSYWNNKQDAQLFPKFLHQVTMIGIDLLSAHESRRKLEQFKCLELLQYKSAERLKSDLMEIERCLNESSEYYRNFIRAEASEHKEFWKNFTKVKKTVLGDGSMQLGSWPHFLFNICGV